MLRGLAILLSFQLLGEFLRVLIRWPLPGSVTGMALLAVSLHLGLIKLDAVESAADILLQHLGLFFVPVGVGLMAYAAVVRVDWFPIAISLGGSTIIALIVTGGVAQLLESKAQAKQKETSK